MVIKPKTALEIYVNYRQRFSTPKIIYILTSACSYNYPIGDATFKVFCPAEWQDVQMSYPPQICKEIDGRACYIINILDLIPEKELEIKWIEPSTPGIDKL